MGAITFHHSNTILPNARQEDVRQRLSEEIDLSTVSVDFFGDVEEAFDADLYEQLCLTCDVERERAYEHFVNPRGAEGVGESAGNKKKGKNKRKKNKKKKREAKEEDAKAPAANAP